MQLLKLVKQAGVEAIDTKKPMEIHIGTVTSETPLVITVDQKKPLTEEFILLTDNVRDYETEISFNDASIENIVNGYLTSGTSRIDKLAFTAKIKNKITIYNGLKVGEKVVLLRVQGGQEFIVWNRVVGA